MNSRSFFPYLFLLLLGLGATACVDQDFDEPPVRQLDDLSDKVNYTIQELKNSLPAGTNTLLIEDELIIRGTVVSDDETGNFFEEVAFEDATGGITILLDTRALYTRFPRNSEVFVQLRGLYLGLDRDQFVIAGDSELNGVAQSLVGQYVAGGAVKDPLTPASVTVLDLINDFRTYESRLVSLEDVEILTAEVGGNYNDPAQDFGTNRTVTDCNGNTLTLRNSAFADFADEVMPFGNGNLVAVPGVFNGTVQLTIRDTDDVNFTEERCTSGPINTDPITTIGGLRAAYAAASTVVPLSSSITGVVISDQANGNFNSQNIIIQDATGGIVVRFTDDHSFSLGDEVTINVGGQTLDDFRGLVQVTNVPVANATSNGAGTLPAPREASVSEILANGRDWESTLVRIEDAMLAGGPTFGDGATISDGTGSLNIFTFFSATFSGMQVPTGEEGNLTAILGNFDGFQLNVRNADDIDFEGGGGMGGDPEDISAADLRAAFASGTNSVPANRKVRGIVVSDKDSGNITGRNLVLQDASGGIVIRFSDNHDFALGEDVEIVVSGLELGEFRGLLQVNNVPNANATSYGNGTLPEPRVATISEVLSNVEAWESTLVRINGISFTDDGTYQGVKMLTDGTDEITIFTRNDANFAGDNVPGGTFSIIAVVSEFEETAQINIRNLSDIIE